MKNIVYLDNSSTTKPCETAVKRINEALTLCWGNPSSLHLLGFEAEAKVKEVRQALAGALACRADEIYFNSCGTEGNNTALLGAAHAMHRRGNRIVTTAVEHPSVLETVKRLESEGFEAVYIKPDKFGRISEDAIANAIDEKTILVSIMLVNNESGAVMPVTAARRAIKEKASPALLHCDAVQAFGKIPVNVSELGADMLTLSAHKIHGPKGIGAIYIKKGIHINPLLTGGGQENGLRSGTESVPLIMGLGGALAEMPDPKTQLKAQKELLSYTCERLLGTGLVRINSGPDALPYILNISVPGYRSETLLHFLENQNIFVSSGSACSKGRGSYVLREMGLSREIIDSALRISFSRFNTKDDADALATALVSAAAHLRRVK